MVQELPLPTLTRRRFDLPRESGLPGITPVSFTPCRDAFDDPAWLFEPAYDGVRALVYRSMNRWEIRPVSDVRVPGLADLTGRVAKLLQGQQAILDGILVALDHEGKPVLRDLLRGQGYLAFAGFDLLWVNGQDLRARPLAERRQRLNELLPEDTGPLYKVMALEEHGRALYGAIRKMDLRGVTAKRLTDPYSPATVWYCIENPAHRAAGVPTELSLPRERRRWAGGLPQSR
jgi:bifunctional non-homologous end joining protein LigD